MNTEPERKKESENYEKVTVELPEGVFGKNIIEAFILTTPEDTVNLISNPDGFCAQTDTYTIYLTDTMNKALEDYVKYRKFVLKFKNNSPVIRDEMQDQIFGSSYPVCVNGQLQVIITLMRAKLAEGMGVGV